MNIPKWILDLQKISKTTYIDNFNNIDMIIRLKVLTNSLEISTTNYNLNNKKDFCYILDKVIHKSCKMIEKYKKPKRYNYFFNILKKPIQYINLERNTNYYFTELFK